MSSVYIEYDFKVSPANPGIEILIAELGQAGFESFVEHENGVQAYIQKGEWKPDVLKDIHILSSNEFTITFEQKQIEQVNWNAAWEENFNPIVVDDTCAVRATFHKPYNMPFEIVIEPKMSFGTGHHETTFMMMQHLLEKDFTGQTVLDMGCGTAVLAILAQMKGATVVDAIDIDPWCVENSQENIERNNATAINVLLGDASVIPKNKYNTVIANINRNILLNDMEVYRDSFIGKGDLYLSGFYKEDLSLISECCTKLGFQFVSHKEKHNWVAAHFKL